MSIRRCEVCQQADRLTKEQITKALTGKRSIKWFAFILHDKDTYTLDDEKANPEHKAGTLKSAHWHIIIVFEDGQQQQIKYVAKWFDVPENYVLKIKSRNVEDAFDYLIHQNAPHKHQYDASEVTANFDYMAYIANNSMFLTRKDEIVSQIAAGVITRANLTHHVSSHEYVEYKTAIETAFDYYDKAHYILDRNLEVIYMQGASGMGKTTLAKYIANQRGMSCFICSIGTDMLDGYAGEAAIVFDDIREDCGLTYDQFLRTLDNNTNSRAKARFKNKNMSSCKLIIISTILPMEELLNRLDPFQREDRKQFRRRCRFLLDVSEDHIISREYDFATDSYINPVKLDNPVKGLIAQTKAKPKLTPTEVSSLLAIPLLPTDSENITSPKIEENDMKSPF